MFFAVWNRATQLFPVNPDMLLFNFFQNFLAGGTQAFF